MKLIPVEGDETAISIESRDQLEAVVGATSIVQIAITGGKVLAFSDESPIERDGEIVYPQRNARASKLRGRRVTGPALMGAPNEFDWDKYEGSELTQCAKCAEPMAFDEMCSLCERCLSERKRVSTLFTFAGTAFALGWALGLGFGKVSANTPPVMAAPVITAAPVPIVQRQIAAAPVITALPIVQKQEKPLASGLVMPKAAATTKPGGDKEDTGTTRVLLGR